MSRTRWILAVSLGAVLLVLLAWQAVRQRQLAACVESGGTWDGARSRCLVPPPVILQRDLHRS